MKCGNDKCEYDLYLDEADFVICPKCGELVRDNLKPEHFKKLFLTGQTERFKTEVKWYERVEVWLRYSPLVLLIIAEVFIFGLGGDVLIEATAYAQDLGALQLLREIRVVFGISAVCLALDKSYNFLRVIVNADCWYRRMWPHLVVKGLFYLGILVFVQHHEIAPYLAYIAETPKDFYYTEAEILGALTNAQVWYQGMVVWALLANFAAEWIDTYNEHRAVHLNNVILTKALDPPV